MFLRPWNSPCSLVDGLVTLSSQVSGLLDSVCLLKGLASPEAPSILSQTLHRDLSPTIGCEHLRLSQSVAGVASQRTAMLCSCLQVHRSFSTSNGCLPVSSVPCVRTLLSSIRKWRLQAHQALMSVSYRHLRAHETKANLVWRGML